MATDLTECAAGATTLMDQINHAIACHGPLSVASLAVRLRAAPLHIRDAVDIDDRLVIELDVVHLLACSAEPLAYFALVEHGPMTLERLAYVLSRPLSVVRSACRRSRRIRLIRMPGREGQIAKARGDA